MDIADNRIVLTKEGYESMKHELQEILTVKRPALVDRIREARHLGDLSENFDYQDAKRMQGMLEGRIHELQEILNTAIVVDGADGNGAITVGSTVIVKDLDEGFEDEYRIVGPAESSPTEGKISHASSLGAALVGKKAGDVVAVESPGGTFRVEIIEVK